MKKSLFLLVAAAIIWSCCSIHETPENPFPPEGFVIVAKEIPEVVQEIRYYSSYNFVGQRIDGYNAPICLLTKEATAAPKQVSHEVNAQGYTLLLYDGYRPQRAVDHFVRWAEDVADTLTKAYFYPNIDKSVLFEQGYIFSRSGHSRGSTIDLTLIDKATGKILDMGGVFDYFGELSHPDYEYITPQQKANRMLLREVMLRHGFLPLDSEWWHFTLKDEPYPNTYFDFPIGL